MSLLCFCFCLLLFYCKCFFSCQEVTVTSHSEHTILPSVFAFFLLDRPRYFFSFSVSLLSSPNQPTNHDASYFDNPGCCCRCTPCCCCHLWRRCFRGVSPPPSWQTLWYLPQNPPLQGSKYSPQVPCCQKHFSQHGQGFPYFPP
jgi:hypothetical protein